VTLRERNVHPATWGGEAREEKPAFKAKPLDMVIGSGKREKRGDAMWASARKYREEKRPKEKELLCMTRKMVRLPRSAGPGKSEKAHRRKIGEWERGKFRSGMRRSGLPTFPAEKKRAFRGQKQAKGKD